LSTVPPITRIVLYKLWLGYFEREGPVEGHLLGVDHRQREMPSAVVEVVLVSLLGDDGQVRSFELHDLASIQVLDEAVRRDLDPFLRIQLSAKLKDARRFAIAAQGEGRRTLRLGYTVEVPVWKATYRLVLGEESRPPMIQGWAIVNNTQDEDWEDVQLSLVSGLPVSFVHDLDTPRYIKRPEVTVKDDRRPPARGRGGDRVRGRGRRLGDGARPPVSRTGRGDARYDFRSSKGRDGRPAPAAHRRQRDPGAGPRAQARRPVRVRGGAIHTEQQRICDNLKALDDRPLEKELRERFLRTLNHQEDRLEKIESEITIQTNERDQCRAKINDLIATLDYEADV
jgi:hypothetical protein